MDLPVGTTAPSVCTLYPRGTYAVRTKRRPGGMGLPGAHGGDREPTPRAQDTSVERHTARESIAWFANDLGGEAAPAILGLAAQLSDGQATALASMLGRL